MFYFLLSIICIIQASFATKLGCTSTSKKLTCKLLDQGRALSLRDRKSSLLFAIKISQIGADQLSAEAARNAQSWSSLPASNARSPVYQYLYAVDAVTFDLEAIVEQIKKKSGKQRVQFAQFQLKITHRSAASIATPYISDVCTIYRISNGFNVRITPVAKTSEIRKSSTQVTRLHVDPVTIPADAAVPEQHNTTTANSTPVQTAMDAAFNLELGLLASRPGSTTLTTGVNTTTTTTTTTLPPSSAPTRPPTTSQQPTQAPTDVVLTPLLLPQNTHDTELEWSLANYNESVDGWDDHVESEPDIISVVNGDMDQTSSFSTTSSELRLDRASISVDHQNAYALFSSDDSALSNLSTTADNDTFRPTEMSNESFVAVTEIFDLLEQDEEETEVVAVMDGQDAESGSLFSFFGKHYQCTIVVAVFAGLCVALVGASFVCRRKRPRYRKQGTVAIATAMQLKMNDADNMMIQQSLRSTQSGEIDKDEGQEFV